MTKPRIAQICFSTAKGGLESSVVDMAAEFGKRGYASYCVCTEGSAIQDMLASRPHVKTITVQAKRKYFDWPTSRAIARFIDREQIDTLVLHALSDIWLVYPSVMFRPQVKVFGICRMFIRNVNKKDFLHRLLYRRFTKVIALAQNQLEELLNCVPLRREDCLIIPNGVDTKKFLPGGRNESFRSELGIGAGDILIGYVGRLDRQKGILELLEAMSRLDTQPLTRLVLVGDETPDQAGFRDEILATIEQLKITDRVRLVPHRSDVPEVMKAFDIFVMPSYEEAFGKVLIEAMATGLPCISTNAGGPAEILEGQTAGLLVKPKSSEELTSALKRLIERADLRQSLAHQARLTAERKYEKTLVFKKIEDAFQSHSIG